MPYVQRESGKIVGVYARMQEGYAEEELPDDDVEVLAFLAPPENQPYVLYKTTIWLRLSDNEAETVMAAKEMQPAKFRGLWDDSLSIESDSPFFETLKMFLTAALSAERAVALLQTE